MSQTTLRAPRPDISITTASGRSTIREEAEDRLRAWLVDHSITLLRISLGLVFLTSGVQKFIPGLSPAEDLAVRTVDTLTLGMVSGGTALLLTAVMETVIGLTFTTGRFLRLGVVVLASALVGIMSPLVLFPGEMFSPGPTLVAQYVFKDIVLAAAGLVVAAYTLGARLGPDRDGRPAR